MIRANAQPAQQATKIHEITGDGSVAPDSNTPSQGGLRRPQVDSATWLGNVRPRPIAAPPLDKQPNPDTTDAGKTDTTHDPTAEWRTVYQEVNDLRTQLDQMPGGNVINQQGAIDCIAQIAGGDIVTITEYFKEHNLNITLNQWNDFSPAVESIRAELLRAQAAQILPSEIAQQTQTSLNIALEQAYNQSNNAAAIQTALDAARQSLESYATQVVRKIKMEFAAANQKMKSPVYREEIAPVHTRRARGWLGIFVGIAKLILAIEFVSKLVPLLALL